jgi:DNA-binding IclR family transcriptional regulator
MRSKITVIGAPGVVDTLMEGDIADVAQKMGIQQNYLYRVLPGLEQEGKVRKEGRGWFAKGD